MTRRDRVLHLAHHGSRADRVVPAAFFLHFPPECHAGPAAVQAHIDYFRETGNDIMKVQYEHPYPRLDAIRRSHDWTNMPCYETSFYQDQLDVVSGVVDALGDEAVVIVTLYSPFMFAQQTVGRDAIVRHAQDSPDALRAGLDIIVESMGRFIDGCIERGADGFYASTQGGERGRLGMDLFERVVKPTDLAVWERFRDRTACNVLHICDYEGRIESLNTYTDYPGHIVSAPNHAGDARVDGRTIAELFGRPFMGGMERLGVLSNGPPDAVAPAARQALEEGPDAMILGADCTLAPNADRTSIARAVAVAHDWGTA